MYPLSKTKANIIVVAGILSPLTILLIATDSAFQPINFWLGYAAGFLFVAYLGIASFRKIRKGYSEKDITTIAKNSKRVKFLLSITTGAGVLIQSFLRHQQLSMLLFGVCLGIFLGTALLIFLDNVSHIGIFIWNSKNEEVKQAYINPDSLLGTQEKQPDDIPPVS